MDQILESARSTTSKQATQAIISELILEHGARWVPVGGTEGNVSAISNNADPVSALIERVTNAIDATLERAVEDNPALAVHRSPRTFVDPAFGVVGGYLKGLDDRRRQALATKSGVSVRIHAGDYKQASTIDVIDAGTGILARDFGDTILSIHKRNKIKKWFVVGVYGHGGSASLRFCDHVLIISRRQAKLGESPVAFTVTAYQDPHTDERLGMWMYLVGADGLPFQVANPVTKFDAGTLVRHINYKMAGIPLYWYGKLDWHLFDPVLPFWMEHQAGTKTERRGIYGSRGRLTSSGQVEQGEEYRVPLDAAGRLGHVIIRYWLFKEGVANDAKASFIDRDHPIILTYFGQKHSALPRYVLRECKLPYVVEDLVVQVDCDSITDEGRQQLLTSNREQTLKEGEARIRQAVIEVLKSDDNLAEANDRRQAAFITGGTNKERNKMRQKLAEMINRIKPGTFKLPAGSGTAAGKKKRKGSITRNSLPALPVKNFPTFIKIGNRADPIPIEISGTCRIELQSDAPNDFLTKHGAHLELDEESKRHLHLARTHRDFLGGRVYLWVALNEGVSVGDSFRLNLQLRAASGTGNEIVLADSRLGIVVAPPSGTSQSGPATDAPEIIEVGPDVPEKAGQEFWNKNEWTPQNVAKVMDNGDRVDIYVSVANTWLTGMLQNAQYSAPKQTSLKARYVLLAAFHAYIQDQDIRKLEGKMDSPELDDLRRNELARMARTVVTAITSEGRIAEEAAIETGGAT